MAAKRLELEKHLSAERLKERMRRCKDSREARRWQVLWRLNQGGSSAEAAESCGYSVQWVRKVARRYNQHGPEAMADGHRRHPGGARPLLNPEEQTELLAALKAPVPAQLGGGLWSGRKVALWIRKKTGRETYPQQGWSYLKRLGFSLKVPRPRHPRATTEEGKKEFQKKPGPASRLHPPRTSACRSGALGRG